MISFWVVLDNEPPMTAVSVGEVAELACRWRLSSPPWPTLPFAMVVPIDGLYRVLSNGNAMVRSSESADFVAYLEDDRPLDAMREGVAVEDRSLWIALNGELDAAPTFPATVVEVKYLWSPVADPHAPVVVTDEDPNSLPGRRLAAGKAVRVEVM